MSTTTSTVQETAGPNEEQFEIAKCNDSIYNVKNLHKGTIYSVIVNGHNEAQSCTCPHHRYRDAFCKHMAAVEDSIDETHGDAGDDGERVTGPHAGVNAYGTVDYYYWTCEHCGTESTDRLTVEECC